MNYAGEELITRIKQLNDFKDIPTGYWIIGIRNPEDKPNSFDDIFYLMHGENMLFDYSGTTNPGTPVLTGGYKRYNNDGAAVVESNRIYYDVWMFRKHAGKVYALCQGWNSNQTEPVTIFRDGNRNLKSEQTGKRTTGHYGINHHPDQMQLNKDVRPDSAGVNWYSAGCQVSNVLGWFGDPEEREQLPGIANAIYLCRDQPVTTFALLDEFSI